MFCPQCGSLNQDNARACSNCGTSLTDLKQDPSGRVHERAASGSDARQAPQMPPQQGQQMPPQQGGYMPSTPPQQGNGKAVGALVCGICAIIFAGTVIIGVVLGIVAIVLAGSALKQGTDGKAKAGRICGIIGLVLSVITLIVSLVFGVTAFTYIMSETNSGRHAITSSSKSSMSSKSSSSKSSSSKSSSSKSSSSSTGSSAPAVAPESDSKTTPADLIVGTWSGKAQSGENVTVEFTSNGTYKLTYDGKSSDIGNYDFDGVNLVINMASYQSRATVSFPDESTMQLVNSIGDKETYHRK